MALYTFLSSQAEDDSDQMFSDEDVGKDEGQKENSRGDVLLKGSIESTKEGNAPWVPDLVVNRCMICGRKFGRQRKMLKGILTASCTSPTPRSGPTTAGSLRFGEA